MIAMLSFNEGENCIQAHTLLRSQVRVVLDLSLLKALSTMGSSSSSVSLEIGSSPRLRATFNDLRTQVCCGGGE